MAATVSVSRPPRTATSRARRVVGGVARADYVLGDRGAGDRRPRALQGFDHPAGVRERRRRALLGVVEPGGPHVPTVLGEPCERVTEAVERALEHGEADGEAPERAGLAGFGVGVGERAEGVSGLDEGIWVVEVGEGDGRGAHERADPAGAAGAFVERGGGRAQAGGHGCGTWTAGRTQHLPRLDADVGRVSCPLDPSFGDPVLRPGRAQVEALGAASAMAMAMKVSSVHSPGVQPNVPPPAMRTSTWQPTAARTRGPRRGRRLPPWREGRRRPGRIGRWLGAESWTCPFGEEWWWPFGRLRERGRGTGNGGEARGTSARLRVTRAGGSAGEARWRRRACRWLLGARGCQRAGRRYGEQSPPSR